MSIKNFYQLVDIPDYRFSNKEKTNNIDYSSVATDCNTKTISILHAIFVLGEKASDLTQRENIDSVEICSLASTICDLSELAIATNKISESANYSCAYKDAKNGN
ncbi:hypothetical protein [Erwinia rhapontici]|uniref:hypothetical protein n=1 Tax=Erwinia rhapontici TaxID=55212 RepID=UPI00106126C4|nr:hypothetical protein [Erwinia rhapontici]TDT01657.1 hypothetical protein EDF84_101384 [Erwinia rhapontici]